MAYSIDLNWNTIQALFQISKNCCEKTANGQRAMRTTVTNLASQMSGGQGDVIRQLVEQVKDTLKSAEEVNTKISAFLSEKLAMIAKMSADKAKFAQTGEELERIKAKLKQMSV